MPDIDINCSDCGGIGRKTQRICQPCILCGGTGIDKSHEHWIFNPTCRDCGGEGRKYRDIEKQCYICHGSGKVKQFVSSDMISKTMIQY